MKNIYGLRVGDGPVMYVGQTKLKLSERLHLWKSNAKRKHRKSPVMNWVLNVINDGLVLEIDLLEVAADGDEAETRWIASLPGLLNVAKGGPGCPGVVPSEATRAKRSASVKRSWDGQTVRVRWTASEEQRRKQAEGVKRSWITRKANAKTQAPI